MVRNDRQRLTSNLSGESKTAWAAPCASGTASRTGWTKRLSASTFAVLQRGYAIVTNADGSVIASVNQVSKDEMLDVKVSDGTLLTRGDPCRVKLKERKNERDPQTRAELTYEQAFNELESIVAALESEHRKRWMRRCACSSAVRFCGALLDNAELKIKELTDNRISGEKAE